MEPTLQRLRLSALCLLPLMALALELSYTTGESLWASNPANKAETQGAPDGEDGSGVRGIMLGLGWPILGSCSVASVESPDPLTPRTLFKATTVIQSAGLPSAAALPELWASFWQRAKLASTG